MAFKGFAVIIIIHLKICEFLPRIAVISHDGISSRSICYGVWRSLWHSGETAWQRHLPLRGGKRNLTFPSVCDVTRWDFLERQRCKKEAHLTQKHVACVENSIEGHSVLRREKIKTTEVTWSAVTWSPQLQLGTVLWVCPAAFCHFLITPGHMTSTCPPGSHVIMCPGHDPGSVSSIHFPTFFFCCCCC